MEQCLSQEQILGYIRKELDLKEITRVENHLLQCNLCFDALEGLSELDSGEDASYHLNNLNDDLKIKSNRVLRSGNLKFYISAAALFLIACTAAFFFFTKSDPVRLFEEYYKPYPNIVPMVRGSESDFDIKTAMVYYNSGNYEEAITEFDRILLTDTKNETALFYKGLSLLSLRKGDQAEFNFKQVLEIDGSRLKNQSEWYLALSYVLDSKSNNAEILLTKIISENNYYSSSASTLRNRLIDENK